jgi:hypothetical protein
MWPQSQLIGDSAAFYCNAEILKYSICELQSLFTVYVFLCTEKFEVVGRDSVGSQEDNWQMLARGGLDRAKAKAKGTGIQ